MLFSRATSIIEITAAGEKRNEKINNFGSFEAPN